MNVLISLLAFLVAVAVLIPAHEFGHFIVARLLGVKVLRFSVGFGRPLLRMQRAGGTEYVLSALPFGGYVKLLDEREEEVVENERHRAFNRQPLWRRAAILVAGPAFNLLFAVLAYWVVFMAGIPGVKPVIGAVSAGTPAARAGLVERDTILAVDGQATPTWDAAQLALLGGVVDGRPLDLKVAQPGGGVRFVTLTYADDKSLTDPGALLHGLGLSPWSPPLTPIIGTVTPDGPAARAGLEAGERIVSIDGQAVSDWTEVVKRIRAHPDQRVVFGIERGGKRLEVPVILGQSQDGGKVVGHLGVAVREPPGYGAELRADFRLGPLQALGSATTRTGQMTALTVVMLFQMATGQASLANLSGPIDIAHYAGSLARAGFVPFLLFLAVFSISLAIFNILPIPLLDGGQLLYLLFELVRGRPLSAQAEAIGQRVGLSLLAVLVGFAIFNDLSRLINS